MAIQMNFVTEFFDIYASDLTERLQGAGFTAEQAGRFLPEAASGILKSFHHKEIESIIATMNIDNPARLVDAVNISSIAEKIGINSFLVKTGVEVIAPVMAEAFSKSGDGIFVAAASIAWGDLAKFK